MSDEIRYSKEEHETIVKLEHDLQAHMQDILPRRYEHSLSVAHTAEQLAAIYDGDCYKARIAGILHDWDKILSADELKADAQRFCIDFGVDLDFVLPLIHGRTAAKRLAQLYPWLSSDILQAIDRHTIAAYDMSQLDMIVFISDAIEPLRKSYPALQALRDTVGMHSLEELYWDCFISGMSYVLQTRRYLYPRTLSIYNQHVCSSHA